MNEQIRELAKEAGLWRQHYDIGEESPERLEKFAELIVEKCAGIIESQDVDPSFKLRMSWAVKEYFGVKK
jgi:hypothetical protein